MVLTGRKNTGRLLESAQELWDAKGRSIYGDAWDAPEDEILPLRYKQNAREPPKKLRIMERSQIK